MSQVYVILVETGSLVENLHYGPFLCYWWEILSIPDSNTQLKFPIRIGQKTNVRLNEQDFYITVQISSSNQMLPEYFCQSGDFWIIETSATKAVSEIYQNIFQNKTRYSGSIVMGWDNKNIIDVLLSNIDFYPFSCKLGDYEIFIYGLDLSTRSNWNKAVSAKFRYFGISPTCQNPLVSPATLRVAIFVSEIEDNKCFVYIYQDFKIQKSFVRITPDDVWKNSGFIQKFSGKELFGLKDQVILQKLRNTFLELDFGLKISASWVLWILDFGFPGSFGYWISASGFFEILDFGFPGSFGYWVNFGFPGSFGYWILASWVLLDIGFRLPEFFGILMCGKKKIERIERISVELSGQSGQTGDTRIERISVDPSGQSDTAGIGDTRFSKEDVLDKLKDISIIPNVSLNQILFTLKDKFTNDQIEYYNLLKEVIFDNNMENFTTIVRTAFDQFENSDICKEDKIDLEDTENAIINYKEIIHIDNLSVKVQPGQESRKKSREIEILLNHLKACQEVYQPELLGKFHKIIEDFDSICNDTSQAIEDYIVGLKKAKDQIGEFISKRKRAMENLGLRFAALSHAKNNSEFFVAAVCASAAWLISESYAGQKKAKITVFSRKVSKMIKICNLGYKRLKINEKKIEAFDKILDKALASEIEAFEGNAKINITGNYSGGLPKVGRAILKLTFIGPIPSIYYFVRDIKCQIENKEPLSLSDIEVAIEKWEKDLKSWEKRKTALSGEIEKFETCKNEMTNLVTPKQKPI
ncbi:unnamed protein product [Rhizophagus irregularis]|nr:unnamed protein product [Rhizophagus irregularis]